MDGENHGKPYVQMDDLGGKPTIFGNAHMLQTDSMLIPKRSEADKKTKNPRLSCIQDILVISCNIMDI